MILSSFVIKYFSCVAVKGQSGLSFERYYYFLTG
jgi:hypothetical protein